MPKYVKSELSPGTFRRSIADFQVYPEWSTRNTVSGYTAFRSIMRKIMSNVAPNIYEALSKKKIKIHDFQDFKTVDTAFSETMRIDIEDRLMCFPNEEIIRINKDAPNAEWLVEYIFNRKIKKPRYV